uniref:AlNc14C176G8127 protein n=1 Tax=Albugo laibachii Nc14 TaxID=890382 RepID=F0WNX2_9STRA|nr:AlNc14C176G8127 [Albugo laibachii Nc14]|eukprot:CCA23015.1 AlNc14C176G8127 [Albugo laibachii Nc14]
MVASKFENAECSELQKASLKCLLENVNDRNQCQAFFMRYKKCAKEQRERILRERRAKYQ